MVEFEYNSITESDIPILYGLNQQNKDKLSDVTPYRFRELVLESSWNCCAGDANAFILAFDQDFPHTNPNFLWFKERYPNFVYVDRVCVTTQDRGRGIGKTFYNKLIDYMRDNDQTLIAVTINYIPPNMISETFHKTMGFQEVGKAVINNGARTVKYWILNINEPHKYNAP
ncbi:hypothetical protein DASB73_020170 [Starmerella bacillaris]|uniref:N-acetyltransferase domain-containing protein n=1 Tax=Starmerella bacillaris TaxID=1247836 RepID=A0AAV5RHR7_STABA|nr:hypothetical protein DASB73_020170 [Starmerella bacillaris]